MTGRDPLTLPKRDAQGRLLEAPIWLQPGWKRVNDAGLGVGGARRKLCARMNCRVIALKRSDYCRQHDFNWQRKRSEQLRDGTGKPPTAAELTRLYRADVKSMWLRDPWRTLATIWFGPDIEADFIEHCRRAGFPPAETAPVVATNLRWAWWRSVLNHDDDLGWQRALTAARKRQTKIGPPPDYYVHVPPPATPPDDPRIKVVTGRAALWEPARSKPVIDRTTKAKVRRQLSRERHPVQTKFDPAAFIAEHWVTTFRSLFRSLRLQPEDADTTVGHRLALAWRAVLKEEVEPGATAYGPRRKAWHALLRELKPA